MEYLKGFIPNVRMDELFIYILWNQVKYKVMYHQNPYSILFTLSLKSLHTRINNPTLHTLLGTSPHPFPSPHNMKQHLIIWSIVPSEKITGVLVPIMICVLIYLVFPLIYPLVSFGWVHSGLEDLAFLLVWVVLFFPLDCHPPSLVLVYVKLFVGFG